MPVMLKRLVTREGEEGTEEPGVPELQSWLYFWLLHSCDLE